MIPILGLYNEHNYSYMNAALQCLISIENFSIYYLKKKYKNH